MTTTDLLEHAADYVCSKQELEGDIPFVDPGWYEHKGDWALLIADRVYVYNDRDPRDAMRQILDLKVYRVTGDS